MKVLIFSLEKYYGNWIEFYEISYYLHTNRISYVFNHWKLLLEHFMILLSRTSMTEIVLLFFNKNGITSFLK